MANNLRVVRVCTVSIPGAAPRIFNINDRIQPSSPFYDVLRWSGDAVDSGEAAPVENPFLALLPSMLVVSPTDPKLGVPGIWVQPIDNSFTMWTVDGFPVVSPDNDSIVVGENAKVVNNNDGTATISY